MAFKCAEGFRHFLLLFVIFNINIKLVRTLGTLSHKGFEESQRTVISYNIAINAYEKVTSINGICWSWTNWSSLKQLEVRLFCETHLSTQQSVRLAIFAVDELETQTEVCLLDQNCRHSNRSKSKCRLAGFLALILLVLCWLFGFSTIYRPFLCRCPLWSTSAV